MLWKYHGILCFHFYLLVWNNGKKEHLDKNNFRHCHGNFSKLLLWKLLDRDFFLNNYETPWQNGILETFHSWRFYGNGSTYVLFISWLSINTQKLKKLSGKFSFAQKTKPVLRRTLNQNKIGHLTYCCMLLFCSNKLSF